MEPLLLKVPEACELTRLSRSEFYALMRAGRIPGVVRIGRAVRISHAALAQWVHDLVQEQAAA